MKHVLFSLLLLILASNAFAQGCSVCTKTAADLSEGSARGLNGGIIYLALLPLIAIGSIGYMWWKRNRTV